MTKREAYEAVVANQNVEDEVREYFEAEIEKLDERNKRAAEKRAEKAKEDEPLKRAIFGVLGDEPKTASTILEEIGAEFEGIKVQKVSSVLKKLVDAGDVDKTDVKIKGKGKQKGYTKA